MKESLAAAFEVLADAIADRVASRLLTGTGSGWLDQAASPLGRRRHIATARTLIGLGKPGAAQVGRRFLLSNEAVAQALRTPAGPKAQPSPVDELRAELRLVGGR